MSIRGIQFQNVSFAYDSNTGPLVEDFTCHLAIGWTGITGANGAGKTTLLKLSTGELVPREGSVTSMTRTIYCAQRTDDMPEKLEDLFYTADSEAYKYISALKLDPEWLYRWDTLSHGERKKAQIAVALWQEPEVLAIDEPTNHIDIDTKMILLKALQTYKGVGLLVSHDRMFLDTLCSKCVFIDPPDIIVRAGNFSDGSEQINREEQYQNNQIEKLKKAKKKMEKEISRRKNESGRANQLRSKKGLALKDHDARAKKDLARISGKDGQAGKLMNQLKGRLSHLEKEREQFKSKKRYTMGIWLTAERSHKNNLFKIDSRLLSLGEKRSLILPELEMRPGERIALTGSNGSGKSTLIGLILKKLNMDRNLVTYLPQEIKKDSSVQILKEVHRLPGNRLGHLMTIINRLGSNPKRLLESTTPSPGEIRKILLGLGITRSPHLIIMDEPTNHLDLPSIECLEEALGECPCGLLLVSHDKRFLENLTDINWGTVPVDNDQYELKIS